MQGPWDSHPGSHVFKAPSDAPSSSLTALDELRDRIVVNFLFLQSIYDKLNAGEFSKHGSVPLYPILKKMTLVDHPQDESNFTSVCHHLVLRPSTSCEWRPLLCCRGRDQLRFWWVEGWIAHGKIDTVKISLRLITWVTITTSQTKERQGVADSRLIETCVTWF